MIRRIINKIAPKYIIIVFKGNVNIPNPMYLLAFIKISTNKEYPVNDLCIQQKLNTSDNANIKIDGRIEHPTIVSAIINSNPKTAHNVYDHIRINMITGIYFKHNIATL